MAPHSIVHGERLTHEAHASLAHAFAGIAERHASRTAIIDGERRIDYRSLAHAAGALADALADAGVGSGDRVGLLMDRSAETVVATVAIVGCGAACVPFDPSAPPARHARQTMSAGLRALIVADDARAPDWFDGPVLSTRARGVPARRESPLPAGDDIAYVIHTSGSSGEPKGICLTQNGLLDLIRGADFAPVDVGDTVHHGMSIAFDGAVFEIWLALLNGAALSVMPPGASVATLCALVERNDVTTMLLSTGLFNTLTDEALRRLARVRTLMVGGDVLAPVNAARFLAGGGRTLVNIYGPTEVTVLSHRHVLRTGDTIGCAVPIGHPAPGMHGYVLDEARRPVPVGSEGELYIGGSGIARGYLANPALTGERFLPDPFAGGDARMYRSGDLVRQREDGALEFLGRIDTQVKINGYRVELGEIEHALCVEGALTAACVVHEKNAAGASQLHAFAIGGPTSLLDGDALLDRVRMRLPAYMVPRSVRFLETLPLTLNGKPDRVALHALCGHTAPPPSPPAADAPATTLQEASALLSLLAECVGAPHLDAGDDFFSVGGDSLAAMRFCALVEQTLGVELPMTALFEAQTLRDVIAQVLAASTPPPDGPEPHETRPSAALATGTSACP